MKHYRYKAPVKKSGKRGLLRILLPMALLMVAGYFFMEYWKTGKTQEPKEETMEAMPSPTVPIEHPLIAAFLPLTGPFEKDGRSMKEGMEIAWSELEAAGFQGKMLIVDIEKNKSDFFETAQKIVHDPDTVLLVVHGPSHIFETLIPLCKKHNVSMMAPANSHESLIKEEAVIRLVPSDRVEASHAGRISAGLAPSRKFMAIYEPDRYGEILLEGYKNGALQMGIEVKEAVFDGNMPAVSEKFEVISTVDLVFLAGSPVWGSQTARVLSDMAYEGKLLVPQVYDRFALDELHERFHDRLLMVRPSMGEENCGEAWQDFLQKFVAEHLREPDWSAALGYDTIHLIGEDLQQEPLHRETFNNRLVERFTSDRSYSGASGKMQFGLDGGVDREFEAVFYKNGKLVSVKDAQN